GMDATQAICDSILESDDEGKEEKQSEEERLLAKLCILKNPHIPEAELPLTLGDNILGRDNNTCTVPLAAPSVSKQHATISISAYRRKGCRGEFDVEVLVWDLGSMNGTRKGHLKLTPHVRYALTEGDSLVVADIPCQYVSCSADSASSQNDTRTPESRKSKVKATLHDASGGKGGTSSTGNKDCVNGGANTRVSFWRTPVGGTCLSFEQTPTQPEGTLVPESDSDSDGEKEKGGHKKWTHLASDSDSHKLSFNSTTFLSPASRIVPESEDESSSTPSSSTAGRRDSRQQPETKRSPGILESFGTTFEDDKQNVMHDSSVEGEAEQPVSAPGLSRDAVPAFNMDSDVEEEVSSKEPQCSNGNQEVGQPPNTDLFYIDSDTDVDEDQGAPAKGPGTDSSFSDSSKPPLAASVIRPEGVTMDSDTDVDDAVSETAAATFQTKHTANSDFLAEARDFHLDSDTDVDEEEGCETNGKYSPPNIKLESAPHSLCVKTDTADKEAVFNSGVTETSACSAADAGTHLDTLSDSDTDVEETSAMVSGAVTNPSASKEPGTKAAPQSDSDADTDVDESSMSNVGKGVMPNDLGADSSDGKEYPIPDGDVGAALSNVAEAETQLVPFSVTETSLETTKLAYSAREAAGNEKARRVENACPQEHLTEAPSIAETQPMCASEYEESEDELLLPGLLKRRETPHQTTPPYSSSLSLSETQPLAADDNLQMDLCDDHGSGEGFRICAQTSEAQQQHADNDETHRLTNIEVSSSAETQLYSVNEDDDDADSAPGLRRRKAKPLQFDESPAVETQPLEEHDGELSNKEDSISCFRKQKENPLQPEEESTQSLVSFQAAAIHSLSAGTELDQESEDEVSAPILRKRKAKQLHIEEEETQQLANSSETQSAATGEDGDEDFMPGLRRRKAKPLQIEDESQSLPASEAAAVETQPMVMSEEAAWADQSSISGQRGGKTKQLHVEDDQEDSEVKAPLTLVTYGDKVLDKEGIKSVLREKEDADVLRSPVRQTTMENQIPTGTTEGRVDPSDCKTEEEEKHAEQMRGKKTVRQEEDEDEEQLRKSAEQKKLQEEIDATGLRKEETEKEKGETCDMEMEREKTEKHQEEKKEDIKDEGAERLKLEKYRQKPVEMAEVEPQDEIEKKDEEQEHQATTKRNKTNQEKESRDEGAELKVPPRGRRASRKTLTTNQDSTLSNNDDFPAGRTRSRSNSSNSVCSDKSISSLVSQEGKGRGRGRGAKGSREAAAVGNRSSRRITAAARQTEQPHSSLDPSTSINYERSSVSSVNRGRGGRQRGKGRRTEPEPEITASTMNKRSSRRSKAQESSRELLQEGDVDGTGAPPAGTSRGQQQANTSELEPAVLKHERQSEQEETILEKSPEPKRNVLFTGVVDEAGERVLARLGGTMAKGVADMNCLVTDKVRRTVKFLCALAKGVPVVTTEWLEKSGKAGTFLSPAPFLVKDPDQETKFSFSLEESLKAAGRQSLLEGYKIHVTKSVKPEPPHMKDIISSSGATFLPKMPTSHKVHTVVISCEEDWQLCGPAVSAALPIVTSEFILTGILQQKLDFQTHVLPPPAEGRGRRKT
uniref:Mediator of DNA damage checkpoint protein 1 n=1 Tax=Oryzias latipes TaxID=8090 RepID=A0A3P9LQL2_ORYLA